MFSFFQIVSTAVKVCHRSNIISFCSNSKYKIFFYGNGDVQILEDWECTIFKIEDKVKYSCVPEGCNIFIILCEYLDKCVLKVFNLAKFVRKTPSLISNTVFENISNVTTISAFNLINTELCIAIGLQNGYVFFSKSNFSKEISSKTFKCLNVCSKPVKGIKFSNNTDGGVNMFACSDDGVFYYKTSSSSILNETIFSLDDIVSNVHCCTLQPMYKSNNDQNFVVARDDGLYCYSTEGRGSCYALNGKKKIVEWFGKKYILVFNTVDRWNLEYNDIYQLMIIDIDNKIVVFNKELCNIVGIQAANDNNNCLIFLRSGDILTFREKGIRYKMKHLITKNLYDVALKLLEEDKANTNTVAEVLVSYGDHLLHRGDMFGAVNMYSKTIGAVAPFTIVNKLADFRYNECLIEYLSKLNETEFKSSEHIKLLKNCRHRVELSNKAFHIFEIAQNGCGNLLVCYSAIDQGEKYSSILELLEHNNFLTYLKAIANEDVIDFFLEYGYFLLNQYPDSLVEAANYALKKGLWVDNYSFHKIVFPLILSKKMFAITFIDNICKQYKMKFLYTIWTELVLQMWQLGNVDISFVINFFETHGGSISVDNGFLICRSYEFWPGIRLLYDKCGVQILSMKCLAKCFEMYPEYINEFSTGHDFNSTHMWMRSLTKDNLLLKYSFKLVIEIFRKVLQTRPNYILNIVDGFILSRNFFVSHISDFFFSYNIFQYFKSSKLYNRVCLLQEQVSKTKALLQKYNNRPVEFRSRSCDICKQMTKLPMLYFLCQHSFHKECIRQYSDALKCVVCPNKRKTVFTIGPQLQVQNIMDNITLLQDVSEKMRKNILDINTCLNIESSNKKCLHIRKSLNPFENCNVEYDDINNFISKFDNNLNPFNVS